jgi:hypothetical protein
VGSAPACGPEVQRLESRHLLAGFSARVRLFELMTEAKYQIIHVFHICLVLQITLRWLNVLRSASTLFGSSKRP